jgi:hypothetical protein
MPYNPISDQNVEERIWWELPEFSTHFSIPQEYALLGFKKKVDFMILYLYGVRRISKREINEKFW